MRHMGRKIKKNNFCFLEVVSLDPKNIRAKVIDDSLGALGF